MSELTTSEKSRKTKLSKKTNEELIAIILRKDNVEKKQQTLLEIAKKTINADNDVIDKLKNKIDANESIIVDYESKISELEEHVGNLNDSLNASNDNNVLISRELIAAYNCIHKIKLINIVMVIAFVIMLISYVLIR